MIEIHLRIAFIRAHPLFTFLSDPAIRELSEAAIERHCEVGEIILRQGDLVDSVYIIASGEVEVSVDNIRRTVLRTGETIGLSEFGFYSETGIRTATLRVIKDASLLCWPIELIRKFVDNHMVFMEAFKTSAENLRRANFIKQATPFAHLPASVIIELARKIVEITLPAGKELFHQGDLADYCYLICSGQIEISIDNPDGTTLRIAKLEVGCLLGESSLLAKNRERLASAQASQDTSLLALKADQLRELMKNQHTYEVITTQTMKNHNRRKSCL
jgi:CRP/FNR family cyclic AMP-dependent transcriptional regulator